MKQLRIILVAVASILMVSCNKNDDQATGAGDVMIISRQSGANTVYGLSFYAYTFSSFKSVEVDNGDNTATLHNLKSNQGYKTNFYYETPEAQFTTTKPFASTYHFKATFENGATDIFEDVLTDKVIPIPTVEKCEYDPIDHQLVLKWTLLNEASSYSINILDGSNVVFGSTELKNIIDKYSISTIGGGWAVDFKPVSGKTYTVRLYAYMYEPGGGSYDIQAISYIEKSVVWGN